MENTTAPSRSKQDTSVYLPHDFDLNTEARCSMCDSLVNVHRWNEHNVDCFITKNFKCDHCCSEYNHEVNLVVHNLLKHSPESGLECTLCKKKFRRESAFRGHVNTHFVVDKLVCIHCREDFLTPAELNRHRRLTHSENSSMTEALICCHCGEIFSPHDLDSHKRKHLYERVLKKKNDSSKKISKKSDKPIVRSHICPVCEKAFRRPKELERHEAVHSEARQYKCSYCSSEFRHENVLLAHEKLHAKTSRAFKCRICDHNFNSKFNLHRHLQMTHMRKENEQTRKRRVIDEMEQVIHADDDIPVIEHLQQLQQHSQQEPLEYEAEESVEGRLMDLGEVWDDVQESKQVRIDGEGANWDLSGVTGGDLAEQLFENRGYTKERIVVLPENSLRCPSCIHSMESVEQLMTHFQNLVPKDSNHRRTMFHCLFCSARVRGSEVFEHLVSHGIAPQSNGVLPSNVVPRPHICTICERAFAKKMDLTRHMRTHTGEKPFTCSFCGEKFRVENTLKRHEKVHAKIDASHECSLCGKALFNRAALRTHLINHTAPCSLCSQTFKSRRARDDHIMKEHRNCEIVGGSRVGGMLLPSIPGGISTLTQISRLSVSKKVESRKFASAFKSLQSTWKEDEHEHKCQLVNIRADATANDGVLINLSRKHQLRSSVVDPSVSFSVPRDLLSSLKGERGLLRAQLNRKFCSIFHFFLLLCNF
ncbi:hypothetical protein PFISCL1PPCAC_19835 [Pristionchus fissidentatus]|uniref:C2H2-type domain-containing protein n=1 Tax=Pristionchus fissidentatus TaxID=1538716 RepID=A0AAV5WCW5_9BILA|nr:hypothetical protein PFISCL1PPCAC_19835 [Pristionchus fissidentatus]